MEQIWVVRDKGDDPAGRRELNPTLEQPLQTIKEKLGLDLVICASIRAQEAR
jgi:hypothetical protein